MVRLTLVAFLALAMTATAVQKPDPSGAKNVGKNGAQFIGAQCTSNANCASACCANNSQGIGVCSGPGAQFQNDKQGCGFVDGNASNSTAAAQAQAQVQGKYRHRAFQA